MPPERLQKNASAAVRLKRKHSMLTAVISVNGVSTERHQVSISSDFEGLGILASKWLEKKQ
jgi:hypothetical protein